MKGNNTYGFLEKLKELKQNNSFSEGFDKQIFEDNSSSSKEIYTFVKKPRKIK